MRKKVELDRLIHRGARYVAIRFAIDWEIIGRIKTIAGIRFSATHSCWYLPDTPESYQSILRALIGIASVDDTALGIHEKLPPEYVVVALENMTQRMILKGYSENTQRTYLNQFKSFLLHYPGRTPTDLTEQDIMDYLLTLVRVRKYSRSTHNQAINAIKFYYEQVLRDAPQNV